MALNIPQLAQDKANHALWGGGGAAVARLAAHFLPQYGIPPAAAAMAGACVVGLAKEGLDWWLNRQAVKRGERPPHTVDPYDILATALGGVPVALVPPWI